MPAKGITQVTDAGLARILELVGDKSGAGQVLEMVRRRRADGYDPVVFWDSENGKWIVREKSFGE